MSTIPEPEFIFLTELAQRIYKDKSGIERQRVLNLLTQWQRENHAQIYSRESVEQRMALDQALNLAIKITQRVFIPPWENIHLSKID